MEQRHWAQGIVLVLVGALVAVKTGRAAAPQVPSLPSQTAGYVKYAITDLPAQYKAPPVANTNNTPASNPITDAGATLGRVLFYDTRLSHGNGVSCASCHRQANGFSDPNQFSTGVNGQTTRHSPGLANAAYYAGGKAFWDERAASLEDQALVPIQNAVEMGSTLTEVVNKLNATAYYPTLFQAAFGTTDITPERIGKAIAQFERSMVSYNSKYDKFLQQQATLTPAESTGRTLFNGIANCSKCHTTDAHVSDTVHNIGLDLPTTPGADLGAGDGKFKAPSLRNVEVRGRFMHDGRFQTLEEVVQFYSTGVLSSVNLDPLLRNRLPLGPTEVAQLVAYMKTFTDNTFLTSSLFSNPFVTLPGDYTGDGVVNDADYQLWRSNFGDTTSLVADGNGDGIVDNADYVLWRNNFGRTWQDLAIGSGGGAGSVPEPTTLGLLATVLASGCRWRRRRPAADQRSSAGL